MLVVTVSSILSCRSDFICCDPERSRRSVATEGESKDPGAASRDNTASGSSTEICDSRDAQARLLDTSFFRPLDSVPHAVMMASRRHDVS